MNKISLFLTVTPLQILIVKEIIKEEKITKYAIININNRESLPLRKKFDELSQNSIYSEFIIFNDDDKNYKKIIRINEILRNLESLDIDSIFLASIDSILFQRIISKFIKATIKTFDDGSGNIIKSSIYYRPYRKSLKTKLINYFIRKNINEKKIKEYSELHYTIYKNYSNIVNNEKLRYISIFPYTDYGNQSKRKKNLSIFIGTNHEIDRKIYKKINNNVSADIYLPHPMELNWDEYSNAILIDVIAEEYIIEKLNEYEFIYLYSFDSSVLLNIIHDRIKKIVIDKNCKEEVFQQSYIEIAENLGCTIESIEKYL